MSSLYTRFVKKTIIKKRNKISGTEQQVDDKKKTPTRSIKYFIIGHVCVPWV